MSISVLFFVGVLATTLTPEQVVEKVQATYGRAGAIEGAFSQTFFEKLRGRSKTESGKLWASRDGRVRWEYREPSKKYFIYDGKTAWFYEPDNAQVTEFERFEDSQLSTALEFLLGRGKLTQSFEVRACKSHCDRFSTINGKEHAVVALWPKDEIPTVDHRLFVVDEGAWRVVKTVVFDPLGNRTEYAFTDMKFGATISDKKFEFRVPEGVNRLRAISE